MTLAIVAAIGATLIVVRGTIFNRLRPFWPAMFACSQCTGFWIGAALGASLGAAEIVKNVFVYGCVVSVLSLATDIVLCKLAGGPAEEE